MVFKHAVEPEQGDGVAEDVLDTLSLWQSVGDATRTEHLERLDHHNLALRSAKVGLSAVLNQRVIASSGAAGYADCMLTGGCAPAKGHKMGEGAGQAG